MLLCDTILCPADDNRLACYLMHFLTGLNTCIYVRIPVMICSQVRICRVNPDGSLARERSLQVCVLAVPTFMTIADLCRFIGQVVS